MSNRTKHQPKVQYKPQNVGTIDRSIRAIIGFAALAAVFIAARTTETFLGYTTDTFPYFAATAIAFYPALTAILGWDPFYQVFRVRSCSKIQGDVCGSVKEQLDAIFQTEEYQRS